MVAKKDDASFTFWQGAKAEAVAAPSVIRIRHWPGSFSIFWRGDKYEFQGVRGDPGIVAPHSFNRTSGTGRCRPEQYFRSRFLSVRRIFFAAFSTNILQQDGIRKARCHHRILAALVWRRWARRGRLGR